MDERGQLGGGGEVFGLELLRAHVRFASSTVIAPKRPRPAEDPELLLGVARFESVGARLSSPSAPPRVSVNWPAVVPEPCLRMPGAERE